MAKSVPMTPKARVGRQRLSVILAVAALAATASLSPSIAFAGTRSVQRRAGVVRTAEVQGPARRTALALGLAGASFPAIAVAAEFPGLGRLNGPFEVNPKDAVVVGDASADAAKAAKAKVVALQKEAEDALAKLKADPQVDLSSMVTQFGIADLREATNTINNLMDESTAAGTQRLQRLMIQAKYQFEDDIPFPVSRKGKVQPRGELRQARIEEALTNYIKNSKELLKFL